MNINYKYFLIFPLVLFTLTSCKKEPEPTIVVPKNDETYSPAKIKPVLEEWQKKTFNYFREGAGASPTGLAYEGNERGEVVATGGSGFGVMALIVGAERNWITRQQAVDQTLKIVKFLGKAERFKGVWSHWYNSDGTAHPFGDQVKTGDLIETSFMMAGLLAAKEYYTSTSAGEKEIRDSVASFWNTVDWKFYTNNDNVLKWLWYSQSNEFKLDIKGWNEGLITYILALGAPSPLNISTDVYEQGWKSNDGIYNVNAKYYDYKMPMGHGLGNPLFFAHYSFLGLNPQLMEDKYANYWDQNVAHTYINRHYCIHNANQAFKYNEKNWGLTACYGGRPPWGYMARSPLNDDGVIAPTAALSSYPYSPFYSTQVLLNLADNSYMQGSYGFADAYSPETLTSEKKHLAIDQGPIVVMIENYRTGLIWNLLMKNADVKKGLLLAGINEPIFKQGFIRTMIDNYTNEYDMMRHPDRSKYEINYFASTNGTSHFTLTDANNKTVLDTTQVTLSGVNMFTFDRADIMKRNSYTLTLKTPDNNSYSLKVKLR